MVFILTMEGLRESQSQGPLWYLTFDLMTHLILLTLPVQNIITGTTLGYHLQKAQLFLLLWSLRPSTT